MISAKTLNFIYTFKLTSTGHHTHGGWEETLAGTADRLYNRQKFSDASWPIVRPQSQKGLNKK
jgi:hypothetical protein